MAPAEATNGHRMIRGTLLVVALLAAFWDLRERRIPNWLTIGGTLAGLILRTGFEGWPGLVDACAGLGLALLIHLPLFALRALGGGDVKLMAAIGALVGPKAFAVIFVLNAILGGIVALAVVVTKGRIRQTLANLGTILGSFGKLEARRSIWNRLDAWRFPAARSPP